MPTYLDAKEEAFRELMTQHKHGYLSIPALMGGVGIGKTDMAALLSEEVSNATGSPLLFEAIATGEAADPTDVAGVPWVITVEDPEQKITKKDYKVLWALNRAAHQACQVPTMLLFDDIDKANDIIINALLNLFVHRRFKDFTLHAHSLLMCAGNRTTDDVAAHAMTESIKTRLTIIEVEAKFEDFVTYAKDVPDGAPTKIHPMLLGFLNYKPELLHKHEEGVYRFPTPRGYRETSIQMYEYPDDKHWKRLIERKLGTAAANDFWAWYEILRNVDVEYILEHGRLRNPPIASGSTPFEVAQKMADFAAVFAVTDHLNKKIRSDHAGLETFCMGLAEELRVAFLLQLNESTKTAFKKHYRNAAGKIMGTIIKDSSA